MVKSMAIASYGDESIRREGGPKDLLHTAAVIIFSLLLFRLLLVGRYNLSYR